MVGAVLWSDQMVVSQCKEEAGIPAVEGAFPLWSMAVLLELRIRLWLKGDL